MSQESERPAGERPGAHRTPPADEPHIRPDAVHETPRPAPVGADPAKRIVAGGIDGVAAFVVGLIPIGGGVLATLYWLLRDGLDLDYMPNRSLGKKIVGLRPVTLDRRPVDLETSVKRNWPLALVGVAQIFMYIPFLRWIVGLPVALVALGFVITELVKVVTDEEGRRLGDRYAGTRVVEARGGIL